MKHVKLFEEYNMVNETGEWSSGVDWDYVKENPDDDEECASWIRHLEKELLNIKELLNDENDLEIEDIEGFDMYQGPYAYVTIKGDRYKVWTIGEGENLWIENFIVDNTSGDGKRAGFEGSFDEIANEINKL